MSTPYLCFDRFYGRAERLRKVFDQRFANPLQSRPERFQWDYWHVPGEYTLLRTPAYTYFPAPVYEPFHRYLVNWGREHLGCHDISPPWLSCYIEGCRQEPHQDVPHGPLAFVYSLSPKRRRFRGGETFIRQPRARITPDFNRLTVFNPALTHGVTPVRGTHDPREGRLVIHGWFVNPRPFWVGPLQVDDVRDAIEGDLLARLPQLSNRLGGLTSWRLHIDRRGQVTRLEPLLSTLADARFTRRLAESLSALRFRAYTRGSRLTLPLMFS